MSRRSKASKSTHPALLDAHIAVGKSSLAPYVVYAILSLAEFLKAIIRESVLFSSNVLNGLCAFLLSMLHIPYIFFYFGRRQRLKRRDLLRAPSMDAGITEFGAKVVGKSYRRHHRNEDLLSEIIDQRTALSSVERQGTGILEDMQLSCCVAIDKSAKSMVSSPSWLSMRGILLVLSIPLIHFPVIVYRLGCFLYSPVTHIKNFIRCYVPSSDAHCKHIKQLVNDAGLEFAQYKVVTEDGYFLELDRIPLKTSTRVVLMLHGILDSSATWVAAGPTSALAFRMFESGADCFMGNFRGGNGAREHSENIQGKGYYNYSINEHAFIDIRSFVNHIISIKTAELRDEFNLKTDDRASSILPFDITLVAHSMGGAASLMYVIYSQWVKKPHYISKMVLLSPAGIHDQLPLLPSSLMRILAPALRSFLGWFFHSYRIAPSDLGKAIICKLIRDLPPSTSDLFYYVLFLLLGGDWKSSPTRNVDLLFYNLSGTSDKVCQHLMQIVQSKRFQAFDYGAWGNIQHYGSVEPLNIGARYSLIDIPVYFVASKNDSLIPEANVFRHYDMLRLCHPQFAHFAVFEASGHLDLTYGLSDDTLAYLLHVLNAKDGGVPDGIDHIIPAAS